MPCLLLDLPKGILLVLLRRRGQGVSKGNIRRRRVQRLMRWVRIVLICEKSRRYRDKVLGLVSFEVFSDEHSRLAILKLGTLPHFEVLPLHLHLISGVIPQ